MTARTGNTGRRASDRSRRFIAGDPLRGVAALGVFVFHAAGMALGEAHLRFGATNFRAAYGDLLGPWVGGLATGVYLFFALSGYLIGRPFVRAFVLGGRPPGLLNYLRNRALRILPAYWAALVLVVVWTGGGQLSGMPGAASLTADWWRNPLRAYFGQAWTLSVEVRFYLTVAGAGALIVLVRMLSQRRAVPAAVRPATRARLLALAFVGLGVASAWWAGEPGHSGPLTFPTEAWAFVPGLLLAVYEVRVTPGLSSRRWVRRALALCFAAGALLLLEFDLLVAPELHRLSPFASQGVARLLFALGVGAVIGAPLLLQWSGGRCWRALDNPVLRWLGSRSYSFYLLHFLLLIKLKGLAGTVGAPWRSTAALLALGLPATAVGAELLHRLVERPFLRAKARSTGPPVSTPGVSPASAAGVGPT